MMTGMEESQYVQLNAGRNVGDTPMSNADWVEFVHELKDALACATLGGSTDDALDAVQVHMGRGEWNGVAEDSAHVSLYWDQWISVHTVRQLAKRIAIKFKQDAIALTATSELVTP